MHPLRLALVAGLVALTWQAKPNELAATVDRQISHGEVRVAMILAPASAEHREALRGLIPDDVPLARGTLPFPREANTTLFLAELGDAAYVVIADFNQDQRIAPDERLPLSGLPDAAPVVAQVRMPGSAFGSYPVAFREPRHMSAGSTASGAKLIERLVMKASIDVVVKGTVTVGDRKLAFELPIDAKDGQLHLDRNVHHLDINGDGRLDRDERSSERMTAFGAAPVFRTTDTYLSLSRIDMKSGRASFAVRSAADYERIELHRGATMPDFAFVDLDGGKRRLSEFRGKYLLLDFWGTWCGPCIAQLPYLTEAYDTYRARGFEILGMDYEKPDVTPEDFTLGLARVRAFVRERGIRWPQARTESIKRLYERQFQIGVWPTTVLLDREGRIVSASREDLGEPGLKGDTLVKTLGELIAR